jgi:hypothetical protein
MRQYPAQEWTAPKIEEVTLDAGEFTRVYNADRAMKHTAKRERALEEREMKDKRPGILGDGPRGKPTSRRGRFGAN